MTKLIKRNRAIKYNPADKYWYIEGDNGTKYKQLKDGEIVTTNNGTIQYFSNGVKKNLSKSKPDVTKVVVFNSPKILICKQITTYRLRL